MSRFQPERRRHKRIALACPVKLIDQDGQIIAETKARDISDGGIFIPVTPQKLPECGGMIRLNLSVPRFTTNTYMLEDFSCRARVVRCQAGGESDTQGTALEFDTQMDFSLDAAEQAGQGREA